MAQARERKTEYDTKKLSERHERLSDRVEALDSRRHLTTEEELELQQLKKQKLWTKDLLLRLK